ncbi:MAG: AMP-dependent synthetase [Phycisphaeraceae bacterium]|nr:AMP-dependent synthetase [Phycisphaeraceae bacterium]
MSKTVDPRELARHGLSEGESAAVAGRVDAIIGTHDSASAWRAISKTVLTPAMPFAVHRCIYDRVFEQWDPSNGPVPAWTPDDSERSRTNLATMMADLGIDSYAQLHRWSVEHRAEFWDWIIRRLGIDMASPPLEILDDADGPASARWLVGARYNIFDSCFAADGDAPAIIHQSEGGTSSTWSCADLERATRRVARGLTDLGFGAGDAIAVCLPMTAESVAIYLGVIRSGGSVVSIADSFAPPEIARRVEIAGARAIFTQNHMIRAGRRLDLYPRIVEAGAPPAIVLPGDAGPVTGLRDGDRDWDAFLAEDGPFETVVRSPDDATNVLFSSGTTGDPKAIPWTQLTPIRSAADAWLHHDVRPGDVLAWPTNLGWMMGPWLIYASLVNRATMALFDGAPTGTPFGQFVQDAKVTMLGVVPSLVRAWRATGCLDGLDWSAIKAFSSTGECSDPDDMLYLMSRAGYKPIIEYCGGTEIGGGYITGTVVQPASPSTFSTPALGLDVVVLDEQGAPAAEGEAFLVGPSIGLSATLLNRDHDEVYCRDTPTGPGGETLRRHGDRMERLGGGFYRAHGRTDDTMNLGGIKVSSAEIERVVATCDGVSESAAIAVTPPGGGPDRLVLYVVPRGDVDAEALKAAAQAAMRNELNPLFKVDDVVLADALPRTASNKVMRRALRAGYVP